MKNKKNKTTSKGFEELIEVYLSTEDYLASVKKEQDLNRNYDQYELQQFLELENIRLGKLESFFTKKIPAKKNFSQTEKLIIHQQERKSEILEKSVPQICKLNSTLQLNLNELFNAHFS